MAFVAKWLWRIFIGIVAILITVSVLLVVTGNSYAFRGLQLTYLKGETTANIDDYIDFENRIIHTKTPTEWQKHPYYDNFTLTPALKHTLDNDTTIAFAIIKDGKLLYDNYWHNYYADSHTNSFSMAKTITTMLYLKAVEDGYISSIDEPITTLLPEYKDNKYAKNCTLAHLSAMTSGYDWTEDYYFPINPTAKSYYGKNLEQQILSRSFTEACGGHFDYASGDTQLLAIALTRALEPHGHTLSSYLEQSFWQPLGMENNGYWSLDGSGKIEKAFCCINTSVLDFARFGQLLLNDGRWRGEQLLTLEHIDFIRTPNASAFAEGEAQVYGHSVWTDMDSPSPFYAMQGHLGQRVIVVPDDNLVIVRLGKQAGVPPLTPRIDGFHLLPDMPFYVTEVQKSLESSGVDIQSVDVQNGNAKSQDEKDPNKKSLDEQNLNR